MAAVHSWFQSQPDKPPISRLIWSYPYSRILFDRNLGENPGFTRDREADLKTPRDRESGRMVVWDEQVGPIQSG
jgi:hypothetical protein